MVELKLKLPEDFLKEEIRCGFTVTEERKKIWAVELDLLNEFMRVCCEHSLKWTMAAGSLLGVVRHKGFIPWDDDVDVYMLREDYERLMALKDEFRHPYFLQNAFTDPNFTLGHAKLRNVLTTGCTKAEINMDLCKGIFIDIFPLDGVSGDEAENAAQMETDRYCRRQLRAFKRTHIIKTRADSATEKVKVLVKRFLSMFVRREYTGIFKKKAEISKLFDENLCRCSNEKAAFWGNRTLVFNCPKSRRPLSDWVNLMTGTFEFLDVSIPVNYDEILRQQYKDYMKFPQKLNGNHHGELTISTDVPYFDYLK